MERPHAAHSDDDLCPVCGKPWTEWPMIHRGDVYCGQYCEQAGVPSEEPPVGLMDFP